MPPLVLRRRALALAVPFALAGSAVLGTACAKPRPVPLSVQLQGEPRILRVPPNLIRNTDNTPRGVQFGYADAFYGRIAPALERWGLDMRLVVEPAYIGAIILRESAYDSLAVSPGPSLGLAQLTPAEDAELRAATALPQFAWMAAEVNGWPRDAAVHGTPAPAPTAVRARLAAGTLGARTEYLFDAERSARAAMFWVKVLQTRWTTDALPGADGSFARRVLANGGDPSNDQILDLVTVSYARGHTWTRSAVERLGRDWVRRLPELGAEGVEAADYLNRVRFYTRMLGGDPSAYPQAQQQRQPRPR